MTLLSTTNRRRKKPERKPGLTKIYKVEENQLKQLSEKNNY